MVIPGGMYCNQDCEFFEGNLYSRDSLKTKMNILTNQHVLLLSKLLPVIFIFTSLQTFVCMNSMYVI